MKTFKGLFASLMLVMALITVSCSGGSAYAKLEKFAAEGDKLTEAQYGEVTDALVDFYGDMTDEVISLAKSCKDSDEFLDKMKELDKKYPAADEMYDLIRRNGTPEQRERLSDAKEKFIQSVKSSVDFKL